MLIISFSKTTAALVARQKTVTRREWVPKYHARFLAALEAALAAGEPGLRVQAWSASPHRRGVKVGEIVVTSLTREKTCDIPASDWVAEGFEYMRVHRINLEKDRRCIAIWRAWRANRKLEVSVIRFYVDAIEPGITEEQFWPGGGI